MTFIIFHRLPFQKTRYDLHIDHEREDVVYVGAKEKLEDIPAGLRHRKIERERFDAADDISRLVGGPVSRIIVLSEYDLAAGAACREKLGLPGPGIEKIRNVTDKLTMKTRVKAAGIRVPNFQPAHDFMVNPLKADQGYIIKPVRGAASAGVTHVGDRAKAMNELSRRNVQGQLGETEVEEFIQGPILHFDGLVINAEIAFMTKSVYLGSCLGFAQGAPLGSVHQPLSADEQAWVTQCLKALSLNEGVYHLEAISTPKGPVFLEIANRAGGAGIGEAFQCATGIDLLYADAALQAGTFNLDRQIDHHKIFPRGHQSFGWFVYPGFRPIAMHYQPSILENLRMDRRALRLTVNHPFRVVTPQISYHAHETPLSGVVGAHSTAGVEDFIEEVFENVIIKHIEEVAI